MNLGNPISFLPRRGWVRTLASPMLGSIVKQRIEQECRGRSPLPGCGVSPQTFFFYLAAAGGESLKKHREFIHAKPARHSP